MLSVVGTYQNGCLKLEKDYLSNKPVKVIITFLEDIQINNENGLKLEEFSFSKSKENLKNFKGSFSDTVVEERKS